MSACGLLSVSGADAKTVTVGQLFVPTGFCNVPQITYLQTGVAGGTPYTVPKAGVITSWSFEAGVDVVSGLKLKVGRSELGANYMIVAEATAGVQNANTVNTYSAHIPVKAGDLIGLFAAGGDCTTYTGHGKDSYASYGGDVSPGTTTTFTVGAKLRFPISVKVALDCVVPHLKGKTIAAAKRSLADASCRLGEVTTKKSSRKPGIVLSQSPKPGKQLSPESKVAVVLSKR
jgi:hypothetical protein